MSFDRDGRVITILIPKYGRANCYMLLFATHYHALPLTLTHITEIV